MNVAALREPVALPEGVAGVVAAAADRADPLAGFRAAAAEALATSGLPTRRHEAWRFTDLGSIAATDFASPPAPEVWGVDPTPWRTPDAASVVLVNGHFAPALSVLAPLPPGVVLSSLAEVVGLDPGLGLARLGRLVDLAKHPFAALASAVLADGLVVSLAPGVELETPIELLSIVTGEAPLVAAPRLLVVAGERSRATVVEQHVGSGRGALSLPVTEIELAPGARVEHLRVEDQGPETGEIALVAARLERGSRFASRSVALGGALARLDVDLVLAGEGAECTLDGLYAIAGEQRAETYVTLRHAAPGGVSRQRFKGVLGGRARSVFDGRIVVDPGAQQTDARQSNRNLLLSEGALARSNPRLEIFADDVRCTHGSTVGRLDEEALFYLCSRGLDRVAAEALLVRAFVGEVVETIAPEALRRRVEAALAERLEGVEMASGRQR